MLRVQSGSTRSCAATKAREPRLLAKPVMATDTLVIAEAVQPVSARAT
jgi:hypothetical protein